MTGSYDSNHSGSNAAALKILVTVVFSAVLVGATWSQLGSRHSLVGTWQVSDQTDHATFRFDADGSYWLRTSAGLLSVQLGGPYDILSASGNTYRVRVRTEYGDVESEYRLEGPDRLVEIDTEDNENQTTYSRVGGWILAVRPSARAATYDGANPHLGCWQRGGPDGPGLEMQSDGRLSQDSEDGVVVERTYAIDYSKIPFEIDVTDGEGQVDREIFDFTADGALRISQTASETARPTEMAAHHTYYPCPKPNAQGDS